MAVGDLAKLAGKNGQFGSEANSRGQSAGQTLGKAAAGNSVLFQLHATLQI